MKRLLIIISLILALIATAKPNLTYADSDISDSFTQIKLINRGRMLHVSAAIDTSNNRLAENDRMSISWQPEDKHLVAQGIKQTRNIFVNQNNTGNKIGTYIVNADNMLIKFNKNAENYSNLKGKIEFDIEVDNPTTISQQLIFASGNRQKAVQIEPNSEDKQLVNIQGEVNQIEENITWEIKINPAEQSLKLLNLVNVLPEGLKLDQESLKITVDGQPINLDKDAFQLTQSGVKINLDDREAKPIIISYNTKILKPDALLSPNQVSLDYQLKEKKQSNSYQGWVTDNVDPIFTGSYVTEMPKQENQDKLKNKFTQIFNRLFKVINDEANSKVALNNEFAADQSTDQLEKSAEVKKASVSTSEKIQENSSMDKQSNTDLQKSDQAEDSEKQSEVQDKEEKSDSDSRSNQKLPQAGENISQAITLIGFVFLITAFAIYKIKFSKN